jgi:exosortase E/protease (VPEID-CTERM system)
MLWAPLQHYTLAIAAMMLRALGLPLLIDPANGIIGTSHFAVRIEPACSGLEGIALICALIAAYLWLYRADYRFPAALTLIPAGIAIIWMLNAVRITLLILIGQRFDRAAVTGFHTVAGWVFFNLTAIGIVGSSRHIAWFRRTHAFEREPLEHNPAAPYLIPLLATVAAMMLTAPFAHGFDPAYPVRVIIVTLALWWYRDRIEAAFWQFSWASIGLGVLASIIWIALARDANAASSDAAFSAGLHELPITLASAWMLFRIAGAVITVPIAEELAFRGYLLRKLISPDFETVPFSRFTWPSFLLSSMLFGVLHQNWIAGFAAGMIFAAAMYRRGRLADAICAHAIANALLALYVITTGNWSFWT